MYISEFTLVQHSPIIHFQANDEGATLRASEVKPKLDRFLINTLPTYWGDIAKKHKESIAKIKKVAEEKKPSLYACKIRLNEESVEKYFFTSGVQKNKKYVNGIQPIDNTPFFGNMGKRITEDDAILGIMTTSDISLRIQTKDKQIQKLIEEVLQLFFILHNFGTRQSKGFGCFLLKGTTDKDVTKALQRRFKTVKRKEAAEGKIFKTINNTYKKIKNARNKGENCEKSIVKRLATDNKFIANEETKNIKNVKYERALLGLANQYQYKKGVTVTISDPKEEIERFPSPILFKVFKVPQEDKNQAYIYIVCDDVKGPILNRLFEFKREKRTLQMATPTQFDPQKILNNKELEKWEKK